MRVLVVEDEKSLAEHIAQGLREEGMTTDVVNDGQDAWTMSRTGIYDVILLDIMLPDRSGFDVIRQLRAHGVDTSILCLSARDQLEDKVTGLELGADDYLPKPFEFPELVARIRALSRRSDKSASPVLKCGNLSLNPSTRRVHRDGQTIDLTEKEYALLEFLMRRAGTVVSRTSILDNVWDMNYSTLTNVVDVFINRLRNKIDYPYDQHLIETVRGTGYKMNNPGGEE